MTELTPELLAAFVGTALSLAFTYIPKLNAWFAAKEKEFKQLVMFGLTLLSGIALYGLACTPSLGFPFVACPTGGIWSLVGTVLVTVIANQAVHPILPEPKSVRAAKLVSKALEPK